MVCSSGCSCVWFSECWVDIRCCCVCCRSLINPVVSIEDWTKCLVGRTVRDGVLKSWRIALIYLLTKKNSKQSMKLLKESLMLSVSVFSFQVCGLPCTSCFGQSASNLPMNIMHVELLEPGLVVHVEYRMAALYTSF
jgi:hypothetical protein